MRDRVRASTRLEAEEDSPSWEEGPKMRRSLSSDGVNGRAGRVISVSSGRGQSGDSGGGDGLGRLGLM